MKHKTTALLLCIFLGGIGAHRFYLGQIGMGILYLCTGGLCGIGWILDIFRIGTMVDNYNMKFALLRGGANSNRNTNQNNVVINMTAPTPQAPAQPQTPPAQPTTENNGTQK